jgi:hypothetical protein
MIVLVKEMNREGMDLAPHLKTAVMVMETYNRLGRVSNRIDRGSRGRDNRRSSGCNCRKR